MGHEKPHALHRQSISWVHLVFGMFAVSSTLLHKDLSLPSCGLFSTPFYFFPVFVLCVFVPVFVYGFMIDRDRIHGP
jgi:hypothetical protein